MKISDVLAALDDIDAFDFTYKGAKIRLENQAGNLSENSRFFVAGFELGPRVLIHVESYRGDGFESAWEAWIDSMPEIEAAELPEAYQIDGKTFDEMARDEMKGDAPAYFSPEWHAYHEKLKGRAKELFDRACEDARESGNYPEIVEGYEMDSSGRVKSVGHYVWMNEADLDDIEIIRKDENPSE